MGNFLLKSLCRYNNPKEYDEFIRCPDCDKPSNLKYWEVFPFGTPIICHECCTLKLEGRLT